MDMTPQAWPDWYDGISGAINPAIKESSVDFPQPEGPAIEVKLPGRTEKETSFNAGVSPEGVWYE